jgi:ABC-type transporter Mla MlaB component
LVTVVGDIAADHADELWSTAEQALELAAGGLVIVDLRRVTGSDSGSIAQLAAVARSSARRRRSLCALIEANSSLEYCARLCGLSHLLLIYTSVDEAITAVTRAASSSAFSATG